MKKSIALFFALICVFVFVGCARQNEENITATETGYASGEIQQPQIMYNGKIYFYSDNGFDKPLPDGYEYAGSITGVDNLNEPKEDFHGARVESGQEVYASENHTDTIYVKYENGYAQFAVEK